MPVASLFSRRQSTYRALYLDLGNTRLSKPSLIDRRRLLHSQARALAILLLPIQRPAITRLIRLLLARIGHAHLIILRTLVHGTFPLLPAILAEISAVNQLYVVADLEVGGFNGRIDQEGSNPAGRCVGCSRHNRCPGDVPAHQIGHLPTFHLLTQSICAEPI